MSLSRRCRVLIVNDDDVTVCSFHIDLSESKLIVPVVIPTILRQLLRNIWASAAGVLTDHSHFRATILPRVIFFVQCP